LLVRYAEMTEITQCPQCATRFKVTRAQRESHQGMVRCGRCQAIFNAAAHLVDDEQNPQLPLPIDAPEPELATLDESAALDSHPIQASTLDAIDFSHLDEVHEPPSPPSRKPAARRWPWLLGACVLLLALCLQAAYFFRVELAVSVPAGKPLLARACEVLHCTIPLPQLPDQISIESSTMEADPDQASVITLSALLRNHADFALAYPNLELTLTNFEDKALARRVFSPAEYLGNASAEKLGLPANRETGVKLHINTTDLKPAGYRLFLLYPQQ
ncbi:MAG TPA: zinc-ribbon and DUF3426 domain-containing protein, partial [Gallionellaceae bacterium]|nr:zinc-ribbon and DUF3426 domain-containing protein [Gallionellaceae bacterium]